MSIELKNVSFSYRADVDVLNDVSFQVSEGESVLIMGRNGVGKSTLLKLLNGILKPTQGQVFVDGLDTSLTPTAQLAKSISVTFQNPSDQIFASTVRRELEFGPDNLGRTNSSYLVDSIMNLFGLKQHETKHPYDLLPPQRKLLTIASAVAMATPALAFDEPTAGLSQSERLILEIVLQNLMHEKRTVLIVSHDLEFYMPHVSRIILMRQGRVEYDGQWDALIEDDSVLRRCGMRLPTPIRLKRILETVR